MMFGLFCLTTQVLKHKSLETEQVYQGSVFGFSSELRVFRTCLSEQSRVTVYLVDAPGLLDREGGPYTDSYNKAWEDSAYMFATFSRVVALMAGDQLGLNWQPDVLHCNDWQTGLAIPLLGLQVAKPATVFTIHNLAYQGNFPRDDFDKLHLPESWWGIEGIEFYGNCSFLKAGIQYADWVTTVSPQYASEIQTPDLGEGFDGLLRHRAAVFSGILNGADYEEWDPQQDAHIAHPYSALSIVSKPQNKTALQKELGLPLNHRAPMFGMVCRMVYQKGVDLVIEALPEMLKNDIQVVILGSGDIYYEEALRKLGAQYPDQLKVVIGYDEALSHKIEAGADFFLMPSRYEPCGLNQIYSLRYGTVPIVHRTGGLADTVSDFSNSKREAPGTGIVFDSMNVAAFRSAIKRACDLYQNKTTMNQVQLNGMAEDFSWRSSSLSYLDLYRKLINLSQKEKQDESAKEVP